MLLFLQLVKVLELGADTPKLLAHITADLTIWDILRAKLETVADHIHVVVSPNGVPLFEAAMRSRPGIKDVTFGVQSEALGMGDAIFNGLGIWSKAQHLLIIWGDQVHVSVDTLRRCSSLHQAGSGARGVIPTVDVPIPYVDYLFAADGRLTNILQSREGDQCRDYGCSDVGTFFLSTKRLMEEWEAYCASAPRGNVTKEINFLPFLVHLANVGWSIRQVPISDPDERRGVNTPEDLEYFRRLYREYRLPCEESVVGQNTLRRL